MKTRLPLLLVAFVAWGVHARAENSGITGYSGNPATNSGRSCEDCHGGVQIATVNLSGPMTVTPGSTNTYTLTIAGSSTRPWGGLDVSATLGMLAAFEAGTQRVQGEIIHTTRKAAVNNQVTFNFNWTAPSSPGSATLYGAGLAVNGAGSSGDALGRMALVVAVENPTPVNQLPVAVPGGPYSGTAGTSLSFDGSGSYDPDGTISSYAWNFGDGTSGTGVSPSHVYAAPGNYTVTLTVTDDNLATGAASTMANVNPVPPQVNQPPIAVAGGPYTGIVGNAIAFDGSGSSDPDGTVVSYEWSFGDGSTGSGVSTSHAYLSQGVYQVTLTVTDNQGASDSSVTDATVRDATSPSLYVMLQAPRRAAVGSELNLKVVVDLASLPPGTTGCGTATLFKNGQAVGTESICIDREWRSNASRGDDDDDEKDEDGDASSRQEQRTLRLKTREGVVALARPWQRGSRSAKFEVELTQAEVPSVVFTARVDLAGWMGESAPATVQVVERRR